MKGKGRARGRGEKGRRKERGEEEEEEEVEKGRNQVSFVTSLVTINIALLRECKIVCIGRRVEGKANKLDMTFWKIHVDLYLEVFMFPLCPWTLKYFVNLWRRIHCAQSDIFFQTRCAGGMRPCRCPTWAVVRRCNM